MYIHVCNFIFYFSYHETLIFRSKFVNRDPWKNGIAEGAPCINILYIIIIIIIIIIAGHDGGRSCFLLVIKVLLNSIRYTYFESL